MKIEPIFAFAISVSLSTALCVGLCRWSISLGLVASPRADRWHTRLTPNSGGIAIVLASLVACIGLHGRCRSIAICAVLMAVLGFVDDRVQLRPLTKLLGQALIAVLVASAGLHFVLSHSVALDSGITVLWIIGISNALNLIDNMDGLSAGTAVIACAPILLLAAWGQDASVITFVSALAGALVGFLIFNFHPARIFMGDCGSMFIGFSIACLSIAVSPTRNYFLLEGLWIPILIVLYPIFDILLVCTARRRAGRPITLGGRDHSSHRLVWLGFSQRSAVGLLWLGSVFGACAAIFAFRLPSDGLMISAITAGCIFSSGALLLLVPIYAPQNAQASAAVADAVYSSCSFSDSRSTEEKAG